MESMADIGRTGPGNGLDGSAGDLGTAVRRASSAFRSLEDSLVEVGGITPVVALYDRIMGEMERLEFAELDRVATEIRDAIEALLRMDAAVRKLSNLKVMFDRARSAGMVADGE